MSDQLDAAAIIEAVQQELGRFSQEVVREVNSLRADVQQADAARRELEARIDKLAEDGIAVTDAGAAVDTSAIEAQMVSLAQLVEKSQAASAKFQDDLQRALEERLEEYATTSKRRNDEMSTRLGRVIDEANVGIAASVEAAARPVMQKVEDRQEAIERQVTGLDKRLRNFDAQAGQMVEHINTVTSALDARLDATSKQVLTDIDERVGGLVMRIDEVSAAAARQQSEVANIVGTRVQQSEDRINDRVVQLEARINEEIGQRVADIDAHVGRVAAGLDDAVITLNDRIAGADAKFAEIATEFAQIREEMKDIDGEAIDEMKEQISSALGQAELVRIEMDRFKEEIGKSVDHTNVRLTELETTVQDQHMDVETAVQLERLEEIERAVLALDPERVRTSGIHGERSDPRASLDGADLAPSGVPVGNGGDPTRSSLDGFAPSATAPLAPPSTDGARLEPPVNR